MKTLRLKAFGRNEFALLYPYAAEVSVTPQLCQRVRELWAALIDAGASQIRQPWPVVWGGCYDIEGEWGVVDDDPLTDVALYVGSICAHEVVVGEDYVFFEAVNQHTDDEFWTDEVAVEFFTVDLIGGLDSTQTAEEDGDQ